MKNVYFHPSTYKSVVLYAKKRGVRLEIIINNALTAYLRAEGHMEDARNSKDSAAGS